MSFTRFERLLLEMNFLNAKMRNISQFLPTFEDSMDYDIRAVIREYAIILFHNFIVLKDGIDNEGIMKTKPMLNSCLEPFWTPISSHRRLIRTLRNHYFAHAGEKDFPELPLPIFISDEKGFASMGDLIFLVYCVIGYSKYLLLNFEEELETAQRKLRFDPNQQLAHDPGFDEARRNIDRIELQVTQNLKGHKLRFGHNGTSL